MKKHIVIALMAIGFITGCHTSKVQYSDLPGPVQKTLQEQCHGAQVAKIEQKNRDGCCVYKVEFCATGKKAYIRSDGTIMN